MDILTARVSLEPDPLVNQRHATAHRRHKPPFSQIRASAVNLSTQIHVAVTVSLVSSLVLVELVRPPSSPRE